ncbi:hypothetical protein J6590_012306 [Homalodisca vitripennis]|nr:hypothetical protein J6590_012306 [Homalodisca vitripennis]
MICAYQENVEIPSTLGKCVIAPPVVCEGRGPSPIERFDKHCNYSSPFIVSPVFSGLWPWLGRGEWEGRSPLAHICHPSLAARRPRLASRSLHSTPDFNCHNQAIPGQNYFTRPVQFICNGSLSDEWRMATLISLLSRKLEKRVEMSMRLQPLFSQPPQGARSVLSPDTEFGLPPPSTQRYVTLGHAFIQL